MNSTSTNFVDSSAKDEPPNNDSLREPLPDALESSMGYLLHRTASLGEQFYGQCVSPLGLLPNHVAILHLLKARGPLVQARLSDYLGIDKATMVSLVNSLEEQRLVERRVHPRDGRAYEVHLRTEGSEKLAVIDEVSEKATAAYFKPLSPEDRRHLFRCLSLLLEAHDHPRNEEAIAARPQPR